MEFLIVLLITVVLYIIAELIRPEPDIEDARPSGLGDFNFPTATEGRVVPIIWGTVEVAGPNVVWYDDLYAAAITEYVKSSLFKGKRITVGFRYFVGIQFAICRGGNEGVFLRKVTIGDFLVFTGLLGSGSAFTIDEENLFGGPKLGQGGIIANLRFYGGTQTQPVSTYLDGFQAGVGTVTPRYVGTCYVAPDVSAIYVGTSTTIRPWKFEVQRFPQGPATSPIVGLEDANPINVLYNIMTDGEWGLKIDPADIDTTNFNAVADILATEENGFSMVLDNEIQARELILEVQRHIDGVVFYNQFTGMWQVRLARDDYDPNTIPEMNLGNILNLESFARGSWAETVNQVRIEFHNRDDSYKLTFAMAQDSGNLALQGGTNVSVTQRFPGVQSPELANTIAGRTLRTLSYPLAKATIVVDRTFYGTVPLDVFALTYPPLGIVRLPMRVIDIDYGEFERGRITLEVVQDIFNFQPGTFAIPPSTRWTPPSADLDPFPANEQFAFEAPRALVARDPENPGFPDRVYGAGRQPNAAAVFFSIEARHAVGSPSGAYSSIGEVYGFCFLGTLTNALSAGTAAPTATINITAWPGSTQAEIQGSFSTVSLSELGSGLTHLILIDDEFMLVETATNGAGSTVNLNNVYRGVLDSVQANHSIGATVALIFSGAGISDQSLPPGDNVDVKLLPAGIGGAVPEASAAAISFQMDDRYRRPYPPAKLALNSSDWASTTSLEANGSAPEDFAIDLSILRRDARTGDLGDEIEALVNDAATLFADYPANADDHQVEVRNDPAGANTLLFTDTFTGAQHDVLRLAILQATGGVLPTRLRFAIRSRHVIGSTTYDSRYDLVWDFDITSALSGFFEFGALDTNDVSATYTVDAAGTHNFALSSAFSSGDVEAQVNGGGFSTLIAGGGTAGTLPGLSVSDTIEVRHTSPDASALKQLTMTAPGAGTDAFGVLFT